MFEKFSEEAIKVIMFAQEEARILKHQQVGCEHFLLGLIASNADCIPPDFHTSHSFNLVRVREAVQKVCGEGSKSSPKELPFSEDAKLALGKAYDRAMHEVIYPRHLLLAIFDFPDVERSAGMKVFSELKIDPNELRIPVIYRTQFQDSPQVHDGSEMSQQDAVELCRDCPKVIAFAIEEARRLKQNCLGTEMLLLGLVGAGGSPAQALKKFGITLEIVRDQVEKIIGAGSDMIMIELPFTPRAKKLLQKSLEEAHKLGQESMDSRHLLLGLTHERDGVAWQVLNENNIHFVALRETVLALFEETR